MNIVLHPANPRVEIVDADSDHAFTMAPLLRAVDVAEIADVTDLPPLAALLESLRASVRAYTVLVDGDPTVMFGVAVHQDAAVGIPWMLATDGIRRIRKQLVRFGRPVSERAFTGFERLVNYTSASNTVAQRWLRALGFELGEPAAVGRDGAFLIPFWKETPCASPPLSPL